jgi:glycosidase
MYTHPQFNYMAYNTIRMYDERLAQPAYRNTPLWEYITGVIPYWQTHFGIDGVMIDMGHALPMPLKQQVIAAARAVNPDFAFWDENFMISGQSRAEGYNAVMGYLMFDLHMWHKVREFVNMVAHQPLPILTFLPPENHNTQRASARYGGLTYAQFAAVLCMTLPGMPFVLTGMELGETQPINTGIGFSSDQLKQYPAEKLPLFSAAALNWERPDNLVGTLRQAAAMRRAHAQLFCDDRPSSFTIGHCDNPAILVFTRQNETGQVAIIANMDVQQRSSGRAILSSRTRVGRGVYGVSGEVHLTDEFGVNVALAPGQVLAIALDG